jgi:hypothetical protein
VTTTDPLVQAVAEAIHGDRGHSRYSIDDGVCPCVSIAEVAVAVLVPLIRAQVAAEIRRQCKHGDGVAAKCDYCFAYSAAARITEGTDRG